MERIKIKGTLKISYLEMFGAEWTSLLFKLFASPYMFNLMALLNDMYDIIPEAFEGRQFIHPKKEKLFENFRNCPYNNLRVVVIGKEPYSNANATGIPFAQPLPLGTKDTEEDIEQIGDYCANILHSDSPNYGFDNTFYQWTWQGVLMLDASSTSEEEDYMAHEVYWRNFTREVVKAINDSNNNIIFSLWGEEAQYFERYINLNKHHVVYQKHPNECKAGETWLGESLVEINEILNEIEGDTGGIYW